MKYIYSLAVIALVVVTCESALFNKCPGKPAPTDLRVKGCTKKPCRFTKQDRVLVDYDFIVPHNVTVLKPMVKATVHTPLGALNIDHDPKKNGCNSLVGAKCPLTANQLVTYKIDRKVECYQPAGKAELEYTLYDQNKKVLLCFSLPLDIKSKNWYC